MSKNLLKVIGLFVIGMVGGIFADQIFWPYFVERPLFYQYRLDKGTVYVTEKKETIIQENTALTQAIDKVEKSVVGVRTQSQDQIIEGSGLIVTSDGLLVTLADLVPQSSKFSFFVDGKQVAFQILKRDSETNLALVKIDEPNLTTVSFANLDKLKMGERVFLVGTVFENSKAAKTVNEGIIKKISENLLETNISEKNNLAGSVLFNIEGEVLGINVIDQGSVLTIPISKIKLFIGM
ncbi:MAG: serine protease [Candidatus Pacebacteria bacterium]|nr:serine protease [Candidatus Paceibacterota bacterium]